jgi:Niemann-Pick C1 protein
VALQNVALAAAVVYIVVQLLSGVFAAVLVSLLVLSIALDIIGVLWLWHLIVGGAYTVSINAVSVCNLVMAMGLSVEFLLHITHAYTVASGTRQQKAHIALQSMGASVLTGITITKLVGVSVLAFAPSRLFRIYYCRMYISIVLVGGFHGLALLPVILSLIGSDDDATKAVASGLHKQASDSVISLHEQGATSDMSQPLLPSNDNSTD